MSADEVAEPQGLLAQKLVPYSELLHHALHERTGKHVRDSAVEHDAGVIGDAVVAAIDMLGKSGCDLRTLDVIVQPARIGSEDGEQVLQVAARALLAEQPKDGA